MHTGEAPVAIAEYTTDADLAMDTRHLPDTPRIEAAMEAARFHRDPTTSQPGSWISPAGVPVDLMVAERQAGAGGRRGARIPPHEANAARRARGLEAALIDNAEMLIRSHDLASEPSRGAGPGFTTGGPPRRQAAQDRRAPRGRSCGRPEGRARRLPPAPSRPLCAPGFERSAAARGPPFGGGDHGRHALSRRVLRGCRCGGVTARRAG